MTTDHHIHLFPPECAADPKGFAARRGETHWQALVAPEGGKSLQGWASAEECLRDMDAAGIDHAWLLGWYWERPETCALHNAYYAEIIKNWPDRFSSLACYAPGMEVGALLDAGFVGIGELHPQVQGYALDDLRFQEDLATVGAAGGWVNFHVTEPLGRAHPGRIETPLQPLVDLAQQHPETRFVFAHLGGGMAFYLNNPVFRGKLKNVFLDAAAWPLIYSDAALRAALRLAGPERVLYGTDYPLRVFPKLDREAQMGENRKRWRQALQAGDTPLAG